jgi:hypothetical protein
MLGLITYSLILLMLLIGTWRRPAVGIAAVLCLYGLKQWGQSSTAIFSEYREFANFALFVIVLLGVIRAAQKRGCVFCTIPPTAVLVGVLYLYAFITIAWSPDPRTSLDQWIGSGPYILIITVLAPLLLNDLDDARTAFIWTAMTGTVLCTLALVFGNWGDRGLVLYGHEALQDSNNIYRYETNPLALSGMAGTVFIIAALSLGQPNRLLMRVVAAACIPIALAVILRSGSRGQLIASAFAALVAMPLAFRLKGGRSLVMLLVLAAVILGLGWWSASLVDINSSRWSDSRTTGDVVGRLALAQTLLSASTANWFTAVFGLGNSSAFQVLGVYPHITGLEVLAEEGFFGGALYFTVLYFAFRSIKRLAGRIEMTGSQRNALGILAGLFVFELMLSWKQGTLLFSVYVFAYAIALARLETLSFGKSLAPELRAEGSLVPRFQNLLR